MRERGAAPRVVVDCVLLAVANPAFHSDEPMQAYSFLLQQVWEVALLRNPGLPHGADLAGGPQRTLQEHGADSKRVTRGHGPRVPGPGPRQPPRPRGLRPRRAGGERGSPFNPLDAFAKIIFFLLLLGQTESLCRT